MQTAPLAWIFYVSYISIGTFVVINLFVAIIVNSLEEIREQHQRDADRLQAPSHDELLQELRQAREMMLRLERLLEAEDDEQSHKEDGQG